MVNAGEREPGYAWVVVAVLFLALGVASGTQGSFGLLVKPWETEFGWDRGAISLTASIGFVVFGLIQALAGRWADRIGPRVIVAAGLGCRDRRHQLDRGLVASVLRFWRPDVDPAAILAAAAAGIAWTLSEAPMAGAVETPAI
jgi:MFS family permease